MLCYSCAALFPSENTRSSIQAKAGACTAQLTLTVPGLASYLTSMEREDFCREKNQAVLFPPKALELGLVIQPLP